MPKSDMPESHIQKGKEPKTKVRQVTSALVVATDIPSEHLEQVYANMQNQGIKRQPS